jgi:hypothetical protein
VNDGRAARGRDGRNLLVGTIERGADIETWQRPGAVKNLPFDPVDDHGR